MQKTIKNTKNKMIIKTDELILLAVNSKDFTNKEGKEVKYTEAKMIDNEGNEYSMATKDGKMIAIDKPAQKGEATIEIYSREKFGKKEVKMRLVDFEIHDGI